MSVVVFDTPLPISVKDGDEIVSGFLVYVEEVDGNVYYVVQDLKGVIRKFPKWQIDESGDTD